MKPEKTSSLSPTGAKYEPLCVLRNPGGAHPHTLRQVRQHPHHYVFIADAEHFPRRHSNTWNAEELRREITFGDRVPRQQWEGLYT